ncbi:polyphosphate kinase 2 [bacterium]|nr:polyphosphate kinase 2 [bacterium]
MNIYSIENDEEYINLQTEMIWLQEWLAKSGNRIAVLFEGRDTAGKGGAIMRFIRFLNPRYYRVVALAKPTDYEKGQWYFQRYLCHLPGPGEMVFFDRSWYNRAVVEPVMGFCNHAQYEKFMRHVVHIENMMIEDGLHLFKLWFSINPNEQKKRLEERQSSPLKQWKLSTVDAQAQLKWHEFTLYKDEMFAKTGSATSPWIVVKGDDREQGRKEAMRYILSKIDYYKKGQTGVNLTPNPDIISTRPLAV